MSNKTIWVNGCFDVIHYGHIKLLEFAKKQGDRLVVGIDHDDRVSKLKGSNRPVNSIVPRITVLQSIRYVDEVIVFGSDEHLIEQIKKSGADIIVIGDDYKDREVIGSDQVDEVIFFEKIPNFSSTGIIEGRI
jgi:D-beta-D-heptose 7-phosphate kinase / D-beta-D-heptose 1-phosphate adenosyltransferase